MAFGSIVIDNVTFNSVGNGVYMANSVAFGGLQDGIKVVPGRKNGPNAPTSASITRFREYASVEGPPKRASVTVQLSVPAGAPVADMDALLTNLSTFVDVTSLNRILLGES